MRRALLGLLACTLMAGCDAPDEIFQELPEGYDPAAANGLTPGREGHYDGTKEWVDTTLYVPPADTVEVCTDLEVSEKQAEMVNQPIIPMVGAGGLDMTGGTDWSGLTADEAQSRDLLCQALYSGDGVLAWGDYFELIAFYDTTTRKIDDILIRSGYKGTIEAGDFTFEVNEAIKKKGTPLGRGDGSNRDPRTEDNMRDMDRALIEAFRPALDAEQIDCVASGSCYIIMSGTLPVLVFMSVGVYIVLEPEQQHIVQMEISLKRPFRIGMGKTEVVDVTPTIRGTEAAGIPDCEVTYGTTWGHIREKCLGDDPMAMAQVKAAYGMEYILVELGGTLLYLQRPTLGADEILPPEPTLQDEDTVSILSVNAAYEGDYTLPYSEILSNFKANLDAVIREEIPELGADEPTGVEQLRTPDDPNLPADVKKSYPDRLRPGGIAAAFCTDDGPDAGTEYDSCRSHSSGRPLLPLVGSLRSYVAAALGNRITPKLTDPSFYVQQFERAVGEHFNGGPLSDDQLNYSPDSGRPDMIYVTIFIPGEDDYTVNLMYGGNDDRIHFLNFQKGSSRMERVLYEDAELPTRSDPAPSGVFTLNHLLGSPRLGLGATGTVSVLEQVPETRRAILDIKQSADKSWQVLAPYLEASTVNGYWTPLEGPHDTFTAADYFSLSGGTIGAGFYMLPSASNPEQKEIVGIATSEFFGTIPFCGGFPVKIGDYVDELLLQIEENGYPCEMIVRRSENREFVTSVADLDSQMRLYVTNNMITQVFAWVR